MRKKDWSEVDDICDKLTEDQQVFARKIISQLAEKWTLWTMAVLDAEDRPMRFSRVMEQVHGVSQKSLTKTLRQLEHDGLVTRSVFAEVPPRVEYELTSLGRELLYQIYPLVRWTVSNLERLAEAHSATGKSDATTFNNTAIDRKKKRPRGI